MERPARARVKELLAEALRRAPEEREEFLRGACGADEALYSEVGSLLSAHQAAAEFMSDPTMEGPGTRIGPYKLLERIGEGGFGSVFMAEQEEPIRRRVALKVLKLGMDTRQVIARFEAERQALALMDHPNIARVLDAGTTPGGRPYFVMELVKGVPITTYCDEAHLSTAERVSVFLPVCHAIQHAHQKGIIHRDLKPSNVLVTLHDGKPVPKVIDFGIAKATEQRLTEKTLFTGFGQMIGTPAYMSPEQAEMSGLDIDTRSDVYSLGVLLYELLAGSPPFDPTRLKQAGMAEILRIIKEVDPPKPSTRISTLGDRLASVAALRATEPRKLGALLRGDLDCVVMKALAKERQRRYDSASTMAQDLERYLAHEPVSASPPGVAYRAAKFVRRNRVGVVAAALVAIALLGGMTGTTLGLVRARDAAKAARDNAEDADAKFQIAREGADLLLFQVVRELPKVAGTRELQRKVLDAALRHYEKLAAEKPGDASEQRRIWVAFQELGDAYVALGEPTLGEAAHDRFRTLVAAAVAANPAVRLFRYDLAVGHERAGSRAFLTGRIEAASESFEAQRAILEELARTGPQPDEPTTTLGHCYRWLGRLADYEGRFADAIDAYKKSIAIWAGVPASSPGAAGARQQAASVCLFLDRVERGSGEALERAAAFEREATSLGEETPSLQSLRALVRIEQANAALLDGDTDAGRTRVEEAQRLLEALVASEPRNPLYKNRRIEAYAIRADVELLAGRTAEARDWIRKAHELATHEAGGDTLSIDARDQLAFCKTKLADTAERLGEESLARSALESARRVLEELLEVLPRNPSYLDGAATTEMRLIRIATSMGNPAEARRAFESCEKHCRAFLAERPDDPRFLHTRAQALAWISETEAIAGDASTAEAHANASVELCERLVASHSIETPPVMTLGVALGRLGDLAFARNDFARAAEHQERVLELCERLLADHPADPMLRFNHSVTVLKLGDIASVVGPPEKARRLREEAVRETRELLERDSSNLRLRFQLTYADIRLGSLLKGAGDLDGAIASFTEAHEHIAAVVALQPDVSHFRAQLADACDQLAQACQLQGDETRTRAWTIRTIAERRRLADAADAGPEVLNACAWTLLSCEPQDLRDRGAALEYARRGAARSSGNEPAHLLDTLARAYFENGDVDKAVETQEKAVTRIGEQNPEGLARYRETLARYRAMAK